MNIETALYFLDTNSKVSCPEITAQQAKELADLLREMERTEKRHAREWSDLLGERDEWDSRMEASERRVVYWKARALSASPVPLADPDFDASDYERPGRAKK